MLTFAGYRTTQVDDAVAADDTQLFHIHTRVFTQVLAYGLFQLAAAQEIVVGWHRRLQTRRGRALRLNSARFNRDSTVEARRCCRQGLQPRHGDGSPAAGTL